MCVIMQSYIEVLTQGATRLQGSGAAVRTQRSSSPIRYSFLPRMKLSAKGKRGLGSQRFPRMY